MNLFRIAQQATDEVLGKGAYVKLNKFDPSRGETHAGQAKAKKGRGECRAQGAFEALYRSIAIESAD